MTWMRVFIHRLRGLFLKRKLEQELEDEIRAHLEMQIEDNLRQGMSPDEARYTALRKFGGVEQVKESYRDRRSLAVVDSALWDIRYALRMLRRSPGFTAVAVLTLALGIGANTAIFSMLEAIVLAPLPYRDAERLVVVFQSNPRASRIPPSGPDFQDWRRNASSLEQIGGIRWQVRDLTSPGTPEHLTGRLISSGFFRLLGVNLSLGREFSPQEDQRGGNRVVIIGDRLWRDRFAGSREALGRLLTLDGVDHTIVGVLSSEFEFGSWWETADIYTPIGQANPVTMADRAIHPGIICVARLKPGVTIAQAKSEMATIQNSLNQLYPSTNRGLGVDVAPLKEVIVGDAGATLLLLMGAVGLVLLIACATLLPAIKDVVYGAGNGQPIYDVHTMQDIMTESISWQRFHLFLLGAFALLALLLAAIGIYGVTTYMTTERTHEIGVRMALGADRWSILRMVVGGGLRLALIGIAIGIAAAMILGRALSSFSHLLYGVRPWDPLTLTAISLVLICVTLLACYLPARRAAGVDPMIALRHE